MEETNPHKTTRTRSRRKPEKEVGRKRNTARKHKTKRKGEEIKRKRKKYLKGRLSRGDWAQAFTTAQLDKKKKKKKKKIKGT